MDRCPNCDAPTRVDAKFCTTCGFRLAESDDADAVAPAPVAETAWAAAPAAETATWDVPPLQPEAGRWPAPPSPVEPAPQAETSWNGGSGWDSWRPAEAVAPVESDATEPIFVLPVAETIAPPVAVDPPAAELATFAPPLDSVAAAEAVSVPETGTEDPWQFPEAHEAVGPIIVPETAGRLQSLLDEARGLVPLLAATSAASVDQRALAAGLDAVLVANRLDIDDLRAALERARERPRDIDTILDLTGRVDAVIRLLDAHDRYRAEIESAANRLRASAR